MNEKLNIKFVDFFLDLNRNVKYTKRDLHGKGWDDKVEV